MRSNTKAFAPSAIVATAATATAAVAQVGDIPNRNTPFYHGHDMMWGADQWGGYGMLLGPILTILLLVGIVVGVVYVLRQYGGPGVAGGGHAGHDRALAILKERYAKGEIETKDFEERKKLLIE